MIEFTSKLQLCRRAAYVGVAILLVVALARLGGVLQKRVAYPWDLLTCFESPHLAAVAKLRKGEPLYGPPGDANSEPYPPLSAWLSYAALQPLGYELDIRALRLLAIGITVVTSVTAAAIVRRVLLEAAVEQHTANLLAPLVGGAAFLLLHLCLTSDQPHPDNLHALHAAVALLLCQRAAARDRLAPWLAAAVWAGLGFFTKQTAAFAGLGVIAAYCFHRRTHRFAFLSFSGLLALAAVVWTTCDPLRDFHLRAALAAHQIDWHRAPHILTHHIPNALFPRAAAVLLAAWALWRTWREPALRSFAVCWLAVGFFEVLPAVAGFIKIGGNYNNLSIVDFWLFLIAAPAVLRLAVGEARLVACAATCFACYFVGSLWPSKLAPNEHCYRIGREVQALVDADVAAGRRLWLTAGLTFRFRAGDFSTPRDIGIAHWTLDQSAKLDPAGPAAAALREGLQHRLLTGEYDRVYDFFPWEIASRTQLKPHYTKLAPVRGAGYAMHNQHRGVQPLVNRCEIYELKR
jgi:hypothetical protein